MMVFTCKLCGREFTGSQASFALRGHTSHCRRHMQELLYSKLEAIAGLARNLVGERYQSDEQFEAFVLRAELDDYDELRKSVCG